MPVGCVAIDGPVASGKSTAARAVAQRLGLAYIDTGAMYRALTLAALRAGIDPSDEPSLLRLLAAAPVAMRPDCGAMLGYRVTIGTLDVRPDELFSAAVSRAVSTVSAHPGVRSAMVSAQRAIARSIPVVMAGRDIGTVVLPEAPCKVFLTASVEARVARRAAEIGEGTGANPASLRAEIEQRDRIDSSRPVAPLRPADGATVIDTSDLTPEEVVERIVLLARETGDHACGPASGVRPDAPAP